MAAAASVRSLSPNLVPQALAGVRTRGNSAAGERQPEQRNHEAGDESWQMQRRTMTSI